MSIASLLLDPQYETVKDFVIGHTGLSYYADKDEDFATRLSRRLSARSVSHCGSYLPLLSDPRAGSTEMDLLVGELTIGETYFFRQREHFDLLRDTIVPNLLRRNKDTRAIRIWSAGCATGAEPYSISILLHTEFQKELAGWDVSILATDINVDFLAQAREARFPGWALRGATDEFRERCFIRNGSLWELRTEFRKGVSFQYSNLASDLDLPGAAGMFDLILCRNVLIYFSSSQTAKVLDRLHGALAPGGWLLVGYAEPNMEMFKAFETVSTAQATAYRKSETAGGFPRGASVWEPMIWDDRPHTINHLTANLPTAKPEQLPPCAPSVDQVRMLADIGHWDAATALAERLIESDGLNPAAYFTSALIQEHRGEVDAARKAFQRAIYLDRRFALAHYHLGTSFRSTHEIERADRCFRNVLDILTSIPDNEPLPHGDSITAGELRNLAASNLQMSHLS
jgi:chemotaxis protein methyltransferase CheR